MVFLEFSKKTAEKFVNTEKHRNFATVGLCV